MNFKINDIIEFKNGQYLVLDVINNDNNTYLYLINNDEFLSDVSITKVIRENSEVNFTYIDNDDEFDFVMNKIFIDFKDDVLNAVNNE